MGVYGDATCYSFHATKVFNSIEGGAACYKDPALGARLYDLKNFGIHGPEEVSGIGANAKLNEFCAAMGICNLRHIDEEIEKRRIIAKCYNEILGEIEGIRVNHIQEDVSPNYSYYPILIDEKEFGASRNEVFAKLAENGIYARKYFYPLTNTFSAFHGRFDVTKTPIALRVSKRVLTIPMYAELSLDDAERIGTIVRKCKR